MEMETFRDILCRQIETLQSYFDSCASAVAHGTINECRLIFPVHMHVCLIHCSDDIFVILVGRSPLSLIRDVSNYNFVY